MDIVELGMNSSGESGGTISKEYDVTANDACGATEDTATTSLPAWEAAAASLTLGFLVLVTVLGNTLVILSVFTYRPLRTVQNFFIVSLAVADLTVAILVMPFNVAYLLLGKWIFGIHICKLWLTCDVLCCTASILNLCAIALDRYWAITDPINYAQKRTLKRVLAMITGVWILSGIISSPPLAGWNDWPEELEPGTPCQLTRRQGYVIYSSLGSFFIPLLLMSLVYLEIFLATRRRLRGRTGQSRLGAVQSMRHRETDDAEESISSERNHNEKSTPRSQAKPPLVDDEATEVTIGGSTGAIGNSRRTIGAATPVTPTTVYQFIEERQRISLSKERRAARTLGVIMGVFVVCWLPFFLMYVIVPFCPACCPSDRMVYFITWLGYQEYGIRYCAGEQRSFGWDFQGSSNTQELKILLKIMCMIRRLKSDVLNQLPSKLRQIVILDPLLVKKSTKEMINISDKLEKKVLSGIEKHKTLVEYYNESSIARLKAVCNHITSLFENKKKCLIYAHHQNVLNAICNIAESMKIRYIRIDGKTSPKQRKYQVDEFQEHDDCLAAILSITAANTGLTLTAAQLVVFAELFWNPGILCQAEDRVHRIGQNDNVLIQYLVAKQTADDYLWPLVQQKLNVLTRVGLDQNLSFKEANVAEQISKDKQLRLDFFKKSSDVSIKKELFHEDLDEHAKEFCSSKNKETEEKELITAEELQQLDFNEDFNFCD